MALTFDRGGHEQPRGHALLYYRTGTGYAATYVVVLPINVDFSKYVPPVIATQIKLTSLEEFAAFAIPPMPEAVESYEFIATLAERRRDDLVFGGEVVDNDFLGSAQRVNDDVQEYAHLYQQHTETAPAEGTAAQAEESGADLSVSGVMYSLMSEKDRLGELSKLIGKLRFAIEGSDARLIAETEAEIQAIGRYFPESYRVPQLVTASKQSGIESARLAQLYLERCYKLADADYAGLAQIERAIANLQEDAG